MRSMKMIPSEHTTSDGASTTCWHPLDVICCPKTDEGARGDAHIFGGVKVGIPQLVVVLG